MACQTKTVTQRMPVWGRATTSPFVPFFTRRVNAVDQARMNVFLEGSTGSLTVTRGVRFSNDGITWGTVTTFGAAVSAQNAWDYASGFTTVAVTERFVQVGLVVGGGAGEQGTATIAVDLVSP